MKLPKPSAKALVPVAERWADPKETYGHANPQRAREVADKLGLSSRQRIYALRTVRATDTEPFKIGRAHV